MALSLKWEEVPQVASSGDFLMMWQSEHTGPQLEMNTNVYLIGQDKLIIRFCQAKHELSLIVST